MSGTGLIKNEREKNWGEGGMTKYYLNCQSQTCQITGLFLNI